MGQEVLPPPPNVAVKHAEECIFCGNEGTRTDEGYCSKCGGPWDTVIVEQRTPPTVEDIIFERMEAGTMEQKGMNWKGWAVLGTMVLLAIGGVAFHFISQELEAQRYRSWEPRIENATRGKLDVLDITTEPIAGLEGKVLWIYLYSAGQSSSPLTEEEFEAVDEEFMALVDEVGPAYVIWAWARVNSNGEWTLTVVTVCEVVSLQANRDDPSIQPQCQTNQAMQPLDAKHVRWLNE